MRRNLILLFLLAVAARAGIVDDVLHVWDADHDGHLDRDEVPDSATFDLIDRDRDGKATREEIESYLGGGADPAAKPETRPEAPRTPETEKPEKPKAPEAPTAEKPKESKSEAAPKSAPRPGSREEVKDFLERFDADKDGRLAPAEFRAGEEAFRAYDRNRDGFLSEREIARYLEDRLKEARRRPRPDNFLELFDENRDGKVTRKEYDGPGDFWRSYDHDRDDAITQEELNMGPDAGRRGMREAMAATADGATPLPRRTMLDRYDKDGDGRITLEELGGSESVLQRLDRNRDGVLTGAEVR